MKRFTWKLIIGLVPVILALLVCLRAYQQYLAGEGGFKLGVDLVGGTILVYEVQDPSKLPENFDPQELASALKRRIDPTDLYNVTIRPVGRTRVEIILPTGGQHQAAIREQQWQDLMLRVRQRWPQLAEADLNLLQPSRQDLLVRIQTELDLVAWKDLLAKAMAKWPAFKDAELNVEVGNTVALVTRLTQLKVADEKEIKQFVQESYRPAPTEEIEQFLAENYKSSSRRKEFTLEEIQRIKDLIAQVGSLEFRILANNVDDKEAIKQAQADLALAQKDPLVKQMLERRARSGDPPPGPINPETREPTWPVTIRGTTTYHTYSWVELGLEERNDLGLNNAAARENNPGSLWAQAAEARKRGEALLLPSGTLLYSRDCVSNRLTPEEQAAKKVEYFFLVRDPLPGKAITGKYLVTAAPSMDMRKLTPAVSFTFNAAGGDLFYEVTDRNRPEGPEGNRMQRQLAIILDGMIVSAPTLNEPIRTEGQISGNFTPEKVENMVRILRAGALPATLNRLPVSENTIGSTLGEDTIRAGSRAVVWAFLAVLAFMIVYYRFAGLVASLALFANLVVTVACMVLLNATFTLPGLAGLVLMLGMAVDANVLIYERLREERDRGASLSLAIRNGYDRAFPTIIDTHLSSIFTALVLYAVGNDQLKGFGVSLALGLIVSLYTSLYLTRLIFDIWQYQGWLKKLSMFRFFSKPNIDFMRIRYYWFTATILLSLFGISVFLFRGQNALNIDFTGGTLYTGELKQPTEIATLRRLLSDERQRQLLQVNSVQETDGGRGAEFLIKYADGSSQAVTLQQDPPRGATPAEREAEVARRASALPDYSVQLVFRQEPGSSTTQSTLFDVRTSEKASDLVLVAISRLLRDEQGESLLNKPTLENIKLEGDKATLTFNQPASPAAVKMLLQRQAIALGLGEGQFFAVQGSGSGGKEGQFSEMTVELTSPLPEVKAKFAQVLDSLKAEFDARPQPQRLENFDKQLATETQGRALYAILLSWLAVLCYLWFRFGSWKFGAAAVLCLIHDLTFTLGIIALCHYLYLWMPGVANMLLIQDFKIDLPTVAALLTLVGYSVNDTIVVFDRIREVRGKNPLLTPQMINDSINQTLSRTLLASLTTFLVVIVLYIWGGEGVHLFAFVMVVGVIVGTYSSIYIASPLLLIFGEGSPAGVRERKPEAQPEGAMA